MDACIYTYKKNGVKVLLGVFVDDIAVASSCTETANKIFNELASKYKMTNMGDLEYFVGTQVTRNRERKTIFMSQYKYTMEILERFGLHLSVPKYTPMPPGCDLFRKAKEGGEEMSPEDAYDGPYREKVGSLLYLALITRPDIACAVGKVAQFSNCPTVQANRAVDHIFRYVNGTRHLGITLGPDVEPLHTFCDAAHTTDPGLKSITGFMIRLGTSPIIWSSKKQVLTTLSTMESELDALAHAVVPTLWLRELLSELLDNYSPSTITILQDNQGTIQHCKNEQSSNRTAHLQRRYHFVKQYIELKHIELKHLAGTEMVADQLTKILPRETHEKHCRHFMSTNDFYADPFFRLPVPEEIVEEARKKKKQKSEEDEELLLQSAKLLEQLSMVATYLQQASQVNLNPCTQQIHCNYPPYYTHHYYHPTFQKYSRILSVLIL